MLAFILSAGLCFTAHAEEASVRSRAEGYRAARAVLAEEIGLTKLLIIKRPAKRIERALRRIAETAKGTDAEWATWLKENPALDVKENGFPPVERGARESMQSAQNKSLVLSAGRNFEIRVLASQVQATDYLSHVIHELAELETDSARRSRLKLSEEKFERYNSEIFKLLGAKGD